MSSSGSGPAIMMMPARIRATFMPDPPLSHLPPPSRRRPKLYPEDYQEPPNVSSSNGVKQEDGGGGGHVKQENGVTDTKTKSIRSGLAKKGVLTGVASFMTHFEKTLPPNRTIGPSSTLTKKLKNQKRTSTLKAKLENPLNEYKTLQRDSAGEFKGMNCYHTLFIGRLAYEVTERKLLRELEQYGPIKDVQIISNPNDGKSRGYAFCEYEKEEDMKRAYRAADGMQLEGKAIVVDVERGHTVPNWLPRRLGGGLGGTRLGGKNVNVKRPGRFDPSKPAMNPVNMHGGPGGQMQGGPPQWGGHGGGGGPPQHGGGYGGGPPYGGGYGGRGGPPRGGGYGGGGGGYGGGPPQHGGGYGGGGYGQSRGGYDRGPPRGGGSGGGYRGGGGGRYGAGPPRGGDRGMKRGRDRSPEQNRGRRRYERDY